MRKFFLLSGLLFLLTQCARNKTEASSIFGQAMEVKEAWVQREIPGMEGLKPQLKVYLIVVHKEGVEMGALALLNEVLVLKKDQNSYTATLKKDGLKAFKGIAVPGVLSYTDNGKSRDLPIEFEIKEALYLP